MCVNDNTTHKGIYLTRNPSSVAVLEHSADVEVPQFGRVMTIFSKAGRALSAKYNMISCWFERKNTFGTEASQRFLPGTPLSRSRGRRGVPVSHLMSNMFDDKIKL